MTTTETKCGSGFVSGSAFRTLSRSASGSIAGSVAELSCLRYSSLKLLLLALAIRCMVIFRVEIRSFHASDCQDPRTKFERGA
jgi:hypothetical protein